MNASRRPTSVILNRHVGLVGVDHLACIRVLCRDLSCRSKTGGSTVHYWVLPFVCRPNSVNRSAFLLLRLSQRQRRPVTSYGNPQLACNHSHGGIELSLRRA